MILVICWYFLIVFVRKNLLFSSPLGCGNDVVLNSSNLVCLQLTQPAKLISNYGGSLQICPSTQTQTWTNRLKACGGFSVRFNTTAKLAFYERSDSKAEKTTKKETMVGSGMRAASPKIDCDYIIVKLKKTRGKKSNTVKTVGVRPRTFQIIEL